MKMEPAPWIKDYLVDMDELYCELALEKLENKLSGVERQPLKGYQELFGETGKTEKDSNTSDNGWFRWLFRNREKKVPSTKIGGTRKPIRRRAKRVLVKGDPGFGKTSLLKRIASDWAKGMFTTFSVIFFVFLKLVKPGDAIENVIIDQMPCLEGMEVTPCKLSDILENLGNRCLLILDGLDEHAVGKNEDVLKILESSKLLYTNIILSSRPHSTRAFEKYFPTIVRVEGFTEVEAEKFAFRILKDRSKVSAVLSFSPLRATETSLQQSPILLSFMCLLVREESFNTSGAGPDVGELFTRMVRCLYKKFTIVKNVEFSVEGFIKTMVSIGKIALETLVSGNPLMRRSRVINEVGKYAFDYGLLIGHEDFRLIRDETADIFITFSHRSIQEFLGALFFIFSLNEGASLTNLLGQSQKSILFSNPLFLHFCLWFLYSDQKYFGFTRKGKACKTLRTYVLNIFRNNELITSDVAAFYPAMDICQTFKRRDKLLLNLLEDVLSHYNGVKIIVMESSDPVQWILSSMRPVLMSIQYLFVLPQKKPSKFVLKSDQIPLKVTHFHSPDHVDIKFQNGDDFEMIKNHLKYFKVNNCLSLRWGRNKAGLFVRANMDSLQKLIASIRISDSEIDLAAPFQDLAEFSLSNCSVNKAFVMTFARTGILPTLQTLSFIDCMGLARKLSLLLQCSSDL